MIPRHEARIRAEHPALDTYLTSVLSAEELTRPLLVSFTQWDFAIGAIAETVATLADMGSDVSLALWSDATPMHDVGWQVDHRIASLFRSPTIDQQLRRALKAAGLPVSTFVDPPISAWKPAAPLPDVSAPNRSAIRAMTYRGSSLGRAILQVAPDKQTPTTDAFIWPERYVAEAVRSFAYVYDQTLEVIKRRGITAVFVYNGRFLHDSAVAAAAEAAGLPVLSYDTGGLDTDFDLTIDATHDWSALQHRMLHMYDEWPAEERDLVGGNWFDGRLQHTDAANDLFTGTQEVGQGIERSGDRPLVIYFSSSGDEISELDLDWSEYFHGQPQALLTLADACRALDYQLVVRSHPHKRLKPAQDVREWFDAVDEAAPDLHIDQHSSVDSYTLMQQADVVVTFGSTTGVEAGYLGRPVIVMGPSAYDELGCAQRVRNAAELTSALVARRTGERSGAVPYGLMMRRRGFAYRYVERTEDGSRVMAGVPLVEPRELVRHLSHRSNLIRHRRLVRQP